MYLTYLVPEFPSVNVPSSRQKAKAPTGHLADPGWGPMPFLVVSSMYQGLACGHRLIKAPGILQAPC